MPFPVLLGLPWLASAIGGLLASLVSFFALYFTKKLAIIGAVLTALLVLTLAFIAAIEALLSAAQVAAPPALSSAFFVLPSNFSACMAAIISAKVLAWVYHWNKGIIQTALSS